MLGRLACGFGSVPSIITIMEPLPILLLLKPIDGKFATALLAYWLVASYAY
jgi:hypothetical protein